MKTPFAKRLCLVGRLILIASLAAPVISIPASAENPEHVIWGIMDWKNDESIPDTDTSVTRPVYRDGGGRMIAHQYQSPSWLDFKVSETNKDEISRIYANGDCVNLMLYFVSCTYDAQAETFSYPLNDQFLSDYAQLIDAYKVGGGPLYIQAFPEFEIWYSGKDSATQDAYRAKIRSQFAQMVDITRQKYNKAYIGLSFFTRDFIGDTSSFVQRWDPVISASDVVWINTMSNFTQWDTHAHEYIKATQFLSSNWGLPLIFPFVELWVDGNTPIWGQTANYEEDAAFFSGQISNWIDACFMAPAESTSGPTYEWTTNLRTLKSRNLFAFSLYSAHYNNKPTTPPDPTGVSHPLPSYGALTDVMSSNARTFLYPIVEMEFWQAVNPPVASTATSIVDDLNCSSGQLVVLDAASTGESFTYRVPVTHDGDYRVLVGVRKQADGGRFDLYVDGSTSSFGSERDGSIEQGIGNYQEYDQGLINFSGITATQWTDFEFVVSGAGNGGGFKLAIDYVKLVPQAPLMTPQAPTGLSGAGEGSGAILVSWNAVANAETYSVKRSATSGGPYTTVATDLTEIELLDTGLDNATTYYYVVSAENAVGEGADSPEVSAAPGTVIVDSTDATGVTITGVWSSSTSIAGYYGADYLHDGNTGSTGGKSIRYTPEIPVSGHYAVYMIWAADWNRASNAPVDIAHTAGVTTLSVNQQADNGVWVLLGVFDFAASGTGNVLIRNDGANGYVVADAVAFVQQSSAPTNPPNAPSGLSAMAISSSRIDLSWTDNSSDEDGFEIERSTDGVDFVPAGIVGANVTSHSDTGRFASTTYYYRVYAYNSGGDSATSNVASATTQAGGTTMHVAAIQVDRVNVGKGQSRAQAVVTIVDSSGVGVTNATVTVNFTESIVETKSGSTDSNGVATIETSGSASNPAHTTGCV
ncbi:MAG: hypothetical protein WD490_08925, partial [Opitutales bacterium]